MRDRLEFGSSLVQRFVQSGVFISLRLQTPVGRLQLVPRIMGRFLRNR